MARLPKRKLRRESRKAEKSWPKNQASIKKVAKEKKIFPFEIHFSWHLFPFIDTNIFKKTSTNPDASDKEEKVSRSRKRADEDQMCGSKLRARPAAIFVNLDFNSQQILFCLFFWMPKKTVRAQLNRGEGDIALTLYMTCYEYLMS